MNLEKDIVRKHLQTWRHSLTDGFVQTASSKITERCSDLLDWDAIQALHTYLPNQKQHEIDTWFLLRLIWQKFPHVITGAPVMEDNRMRSYVIDATTTLHESVFGIPEPLNTAEADSELFDVIIVPVTGFNKTGHRLGYGFGHYDRFLAGQSSAITIGLAYDAAETDFPIEAHDVPLSYIVTEKRVIDTKASPTKKL